MHAYAWVLLPTYIRLRNGSNIEIIWLNYKLGYKYVPVYNSYKSYNIANLA